MFGRFGSVPCGASGACKRRQRACKRSGGSPPPPRALVLRAGAARARRRPGPVRVRVGSSWSPSRARWRAPAWKNIMWEPPSSKSSSIATQTSSPRQAWPPRASLHPSTSGLQGAACVHPRAARVRIYYDQPPTHAFQTNQTTYQPLCKKPSADTLHIHTQTGSNVNGHNTSEKRPS